MDRPIYRSLADRIEKRILDDRYPVGSQLPSEPELEREFEVSRITVRHALALLKRRGLLVSRSGLGTTVRSGGSGRTALAVSGSLRDLAYYAAGTRYRASDRTVMPPPLHVAEILHLGPGEAVIRLRGTRAREEDPFVFEEIFIPETLGREINNHVLGADTVFGLLERTNNLRITEVRQTIVAVSATAAVARSLGMRAGAPMLKVTRVYRLAGGDAVEYANSWYDSARFEYDMTLLPE